jgi:hypothetical protein
MKMSKAIELRHRIMNLLVGIWRWDEEKFVKVISEWFWRHLTL